MINDENFDLEGIYYVYSSFNPNYFLTIQNNDININNLLILSNFNDTINQAFYFFKNEDNSYFIMNISSLKILGVKNIKNKSYIIQDNISPSNNFKWKVLKTNNYYANEYYIELFKNNKRMDINNNYFVINEINENIKSQRFKFKKCIYNIIKSDLWQKWEKYRYREFIENHFYIIRSAQNENYVFNLDLFNNNITLKYFNGNKEQLFFIIKINNYFHIYPFAMIQLIEKNILNGIKYLNINEKFLEININKENYDYNKIQLYSISNKLGLKLDISENNLLDFKFSNNNNSHKFYFSSVNDVIFKRYIFQNLIYFNSGEKIPLKYEFILDYELDGFKNMNSVAIDKNTKYISDSVFKKINNLKEIKINIEWLNKFNSKNIISIEFNDVKILYFDLKLLKNFINLNELHLPLSINKIIGSYKIYTPKLKKLECSPKLLIYFKGISLDAFYIHRDIKKFEGNFNLFENINSKILYLFNNLKIDKLGIFNNIFFKNIYCNVHHVKFLNKSIVSTIFIGYDENEDTIYSNTFENFINLKIVLLSKNIKKIESKGFINCKNLEYIKLPENCTDIKWDSFFNCIKLKIDCKKEIKQKLEQFAKLNNKSILNINDLKNYSSVEAIEIEYDTKIIGNALKNLNNLKMIKCNPEILNKLPLSKINENNLTTLIIQNKTKKLTKDMFKYCVNLEYLSIPLSVQEIEEGTFDECTCLRIIECDPIFLRYFKNHYITTFIIQEGVKFIYKSYFKDITYIQNLIIPKSEYNIELGSFYNLKKVIFLKCEDKWNNNNYFPFEYRIEEGTKFINPQIFRGWYNLKTLIIPNSVNTILPFTFSNCRGIKNLKCSPDYFKFLYVKSVKVLVLPEGVEKLKNGDLKGFTNLIYLRLPNSIKIIEEDVFNDTPCLNYENISDHPLIRKIRRKKFENKYNDIKKDFNFFDLLRILPSIDKPNYNFENDNKNKNNIYEDQRNYNLLINNPFIKTKNEYKIEESEESKCNKYNCQSTQNIFTTNYNQSSQKNIFQNNNNINNNKNHNLINNFIDNKNTKKERTVEDIIEYDKTNIKYSTFITKIINSINKRKNFLQKGTSLQNLSYKLADICIKINRAYNFIPRPVQILAILRLADAVFTDNNKGSIGEIKTGEGKSFIVSTLAILLCQFDKKIDIVTSNIELASRDQKEQEKNFKLFGITSGVLYKEDEKEYLKGNNSYNLKIKQGYDLDVFQNQVVYSTNANFEFVYLNSMFVCNPLRPYERKYDVVIVDEVDNMFIDQGTSPALISEPCDIYHYEDILNVIYYNREKRIEALQEQINLMLGGYGFFNTEQGLKKINDLKNAALASDRKIRNIDYIVYEGKVIIIDSFTGLKKPNSKWKDSIHEMVEIKEGIKPDNNSVTYTAVTQHDFFNLYNKILGVTGTVGTDKDRKDLKSIYGVEIFKCPRHFLREKKIYQTKRPVGLDNIFYSLNKEIKREITKDRPVLVIMDNIRNVEEFVQQSPLKNLNTIKGINPDEDELSRNVAGQERNVTIATSAAGRGVDIKLSKISQKNGGLHVIIPFLMPNQRALEQAAGRCGRQGQPGSVNIYCSEDDYYLMSQAFDIREHNLWIIQNILVEYIHSNYGFLFEGKGEHRMDNIIYPLCIPIPDAMNVYSFRISKIEGIFEEKKELIFDYFMDMIKLTWGLFFNDLTNDKKCENINYCQGKLKEYLNYLNEYIPKYLNYSKLYKNNIITSCQNKLSKYKKFSEITFGLLKLSADIFSTIACPEFRPIILGGLNSAEVIVNALINGEEINWGKVFLKFGEGCLDGFSFKSKVGKLTYDIIGSPLLEYGEAKIDGKDYNLFQGVNRKLFDKAAGKFSEQLNKNIRNPVKHLLADSNFNNEGYKKMFEKRSKIGNKKIIKEINKEVENYLINFNQNFQNNLDKLYLYNLAGMIDETTRDGLLGNSNIENELFENTIIKTNKKTINDFIQKKFHNEKTKTSSKSDIKNGLDALLNKKK